jgi:hypothetical protein
MIEIRLSLLRGICQLPAYVAHVNGSAPGWNKESQWSREDKIFVFLTGQGRVP